VVGGLGSLAALRKARGAGLQIAREPH
jgi:hypothetical protein